MKAPARRHASAGGPAARLRAATCTHSPIRTLTRVAARERTTAVQSAAAPPTPRATANSPPKTWATGAAPKKYAETTSSYDISAAASPDYLLDGAGSAVAGCCRGAARHRRGQAPLRPRVRGALHAHASCNCNCHWHSMDSCVVSRDDAARSADGSDAHAHATRAGWPQNRPRAGRGPARFSTERSRLEIRRARSPPPSVHPLPPHDEGRPRRGSRAAAAIEGLGGVPVPRRGWQHRQRPHLLAQLEAHVRQFEMALREISACLKVAASVR